MVFLKPNALFLFIAMMEGLHKMHFGMQLGYSIFQVCNEMGDYYKLAIHFCKLLLFSCPSI
jgi:hypothetical protein